ncbi:DUF937 domain-containing protein [Deinococcus navajonensis]|uniref:DUF937 domain-containing protein n=1 Tax=Deinococcus navajonensis TaxID=309884 RepID=A0ABV8XST1_9DEIO
MNVTDLMQTFFSQEAAGLLGEVAGLDQRTATQALAAGVPLQLVALVEQASDAEGRALLDEAVNNLPTFDSTASAVSSQDGAARLGQAGQVLAPVLLGSGHHHIEEVAVAASGGTPQRVAHLLQLALPLLISGLGQRAGASGLEPLLQGLKESALAAGAGTSGADGPAQEDARLTPSLLLDLYKAQFSGKNAERLGVIAGFGPESQRATVAALPLILDALVERGRTGAGTSEVLSMSREFTELSGAGGQLRLDFLDDPGTSDRIETQGRALLRRLFGSVEELAGRLGTALGATGHSGERLLALLLPLVLAVMGRRTQEGRLSEAAVGRLLGDLSGSLAGLLPAGLTGLSALLGRTGLTTAQASVPPLVSGPGPGVAGAITNSAAPTVPTTRSRRGRLWWLVPLLLLVLSGWWLLRPARPETHSAPTPTAQLITVEKPKFGVVASRKGSSNVTELQTVGPGYPLGSLQDERATAPRAGRQLAEVTHAVQHGDARPLPG